MRRVAERLLRHRLTQRRPPRHGVGGRDAIRPRMTAQRPISRYLVHRKLANLISSSPPGSPYVASHLERALAPSRPAVGQPPPPGDPGGPNGARLAGLRLRTIRITRAPGLATHRSADAARTPSDRFCSPAASTYARPSPGVGSPSTPASPCVMAQAMISLLDSSILASRDAGNQTRSGRFRTRIGRPSSPRHSPSVLVHRPSPVMPVPARAASS